MTLPFLKWAGGKRKLADKVLAYMPADCDAYLELMVGGGAVFFRLREMGFTGAITIGDVNPDLINTYRVVQRCPHDLLRELARFRHTEDEFNRVKEAFNKRVGLGPHVPYDAERAAQMIFLNKTCYAGLWRVAEGTGHFNTDFGNYPDPKWRDEEGLIAAHDALQGVVIVSDSFHRTGQAVGRRPFYYFDPPYLPVPGQKSNFSSYSGAFGAAEHRWLTLHASKLVSFGAVVVISNADVPMARRLYKGFNVVEVSMKRAINSDPEGRGSVPELLAVGGL